MFKKFPGRSCTVHLKEYQDKTFDSPLYKDVFRLCETTCATQWYIVEMGGDDGIGFRPREQKLHRLILYKKAGTGPAFEFSACIGAERGRIGAAALAQNLQRLAAVDLGDQAAEAQRVATHLRVTRNRRAASAVEHSEEGAFGGKRGRGVGIVDGG